MRAAVDVDLGPERRSPRYHETCLAHESVDDDVEKKAARRTSKPRSGIFFLASRPNVYKTAEGLQLPPVDEGGGSEVEGDRPVKARLLTSVSNKVVQGKGLGHHGRP